MKLRVKKTAFSLVEIMVGVLIVSSVLLSGFFALSSVGIGKIKLIEDTNLEKEMFYFSERLYDFIKTGGLIDYEEYFNRKVRGDSSFSGGHFSGSTLFGNGRSEMFYCRSGNGVSMGTGGCIGAFNTDLSGTLASQNLSGSGLLYGQYAYQFIDYNSNTNGDGGDENVDGSIVGDDDDEFLGLGPTAFSGSRVYELYLINGAKNKRTFLRWSVKPDPDKPASATCTGLTGNPLSISGTGCLGNIEFLKLEGKDWGISHNSGSVSPTQYDGIIDTWVFDKETYGLSTDIITDFNPTMDGSDHNSEHYWTPLFPDTVNVAAFELFLYPNTNIKYAWKDFSSAANISPYIRIKMTISPSWKKRRGMQGAPPHFDFSTTLSLTDIFSK